MIPVPMLLVAIMLLFVAIFLLAKKNRKLTLKGYKIAASRVRVRGPNGRFKKSHTS